MKNKIIANNMLIALGQIKHELGESGLVHHWAVTGSFNLALRGGQLRPSDIDIFVSAETATKLQKMFGFKFVASSTIRSVFSSCIISHTQVEFMALPEIKIGILEQWVSLSHWVENVEYVFANGQYWPLTSLHFEQEVYKYLGNSARVRLIDLEVCHSLSSLQAVSSEEDGSSRHGLPETANPWHPTIPAYEHHPKNPRYRDQAPCDHRSLEAARFLAAP